MAFPVSEDKFMDAETALGMRFPDPLRNRLKIQNGGEVSASDDGWLLYPVRDASDRKRLSRTANDIVTETKNAREWRGFPPAAIELLPRMDRAIF
jgi:cell wall assembly regulator SMI1